MNNYYKYLFPLLLVILICIFIKQEYFINSGLKIDINNIQPNIPFNYQFKEDTIRNKKRPKKLKGIIKSTLTMTKVKDPIKNINNLELLKSREASQRNEWIDLPNNPIHKSYYKVREDTWDEAGVTNTHIKIITNENCKNFDYVNYIPYKNPTISNGLEADKKNPIMDASNNWIKPLWTN